MRHDEQGRELDGTRPDDQSRRDFVTLSAAVGLAASTHAIAGAAVNVIEQDVTIQMPDGSCDAALFHPATRSHPGVLVWTDAFGLRPVFRDLGRRLAAEGYTVLVPNPFYRTAKAPVFSDVGSFNFQNEADRAKLQPLMSPLAEPGAAQSDARAYINFLDSLAQVNKARKIGSQGYCMGGPLMIKTAAAVPERVAAGASFHGGGLVTDKPDSPHLLAAKLKSKLYIAIAGNDDQRQPDAKDKLREAFAAAKVSAEIEVYPRAQHGWCIADMPLQADGAPIYSKPDAERAWSKLLSLYHSVLA
jgi:carboxymethylenebutenolidase